MTDFTKGTGFRKARDKSEINAFCRKNRTRCLERVRVGKARERYPLLS